LGAGRHTDASGWAELPPIPDGAQIHFGNSRAQIDGLYAPMDTDVRNHPMAGAWKRARAGLSLVMMEAHGPGRLGRSHDSSGEIVAVPLDAGRTLLVREHLGPEERMRVFGPGRVLVQFGSHGQVQRPFLQFLRPWSAPNLTIHQW
jgi:hypothetical protein